MSDISNEHMKRNYEIIYEDGFLVIANKTAGLLSIPDRYQPEKINLQHLLKQQFGEIWTVHRLDKDTSGLICFARNEEAHKTLSQQFEKRQVQKIYHALVDGNLKEDKGTIDQPIGKGQGNKMQITKTGKAALTLYQVEQRYKHFNWVAVEIKTGRTHQIRVHFQAIGHPLAVDTLYGQRDALFLSEIKTKAYRLGKNKEERPLLSRLSLHASSLSLAHPETGKPVQFTAPLPKDLRAALNQLNKWGV